MKLTKKETLRSERNALKAEGMMHDKESKKLKIRQIG